MPGGEYLNLQHFKNPVALGQIGDPNIMVASPSRYDSGFVIPDYDSSDPNYQYEVLNKLKAENQGLGMELATAGANLIPNIALTIGETAGYLFDLEDWSNMIQNNKANYGNAITEFASKAKNPFGEVYQKTPGENNISDSAWWVSNGAGLVESLVAFGVTGFGVGSVLGKGASALTKALGAYGKGAAAIEGAAQLGTSLTLAYSEGAMTGAQVFKDVYSDTYNIKYQEYLNSGMGENEAKTRAQFTANDTAGEAATKAVRINTGINTFLNLPETGVLFRSMSKSRYIDDALKLERGEFARDAVERLKAFDVDKYLTKQAIRHKVKETGSEMLEEMVNVYAEEEGKNVGREATGQDVKTLGDMLADDNIWAAGFWGAVGGSMNGFVMGQMPKWVTQEDGTKKRTTVGAYNKEQISNKYEEQLTDLQDRLTEFVDARDALDKASKSGDEKAYKEASDKIFSYNSFNSIVKGTEEQLLNDFHEILKLTPEQAAEQGFASDYKQKAGEKIQSIKENTKEWNKLQDRYASQDLDQAGFPETIFQQHMNVQNNKKIVQEQILKLAELDSEISQSYALRGTDLTTTFFNDVESSIKATEHDFEMATIDLDNILNLDKFDAKTQKRIIAKLSNTYGNIANARQEIEKNLNELRNKREDLINSLEIQKANYYFSIDPDNTMSDEEKFNKYRNVIAQNSADIYALTEGKKSLSNNRKILAAQEEELRVLKSSEGLERFKNLKKEKMAEREAIDTQAAAKAKAEAEAKAEADRLAALKAKKEVAPETITVQEEEIIEAATPVESFEEGNYAGEGSSTKELEQQYESITEVADNSDVDGEVRDSSGELISVGNKLIAGSNKLAYASTVEYTEETGTLVHTSLKLNPETNPNLLTDKYVPGTKLKIKKLTASEFKPFVAVKELKFIDELGREILVANAGQKVTFEMLSHPYMQPIGIYNEAGEYQAMLHAVTYITPNRIVTENVAEDLQTLINIRAAVTDKFQDIKINSKSNGKLNQLPRFYTLSELISEPVEFAIATSSIQLNTSKTTPVENLANKKGFKVGQVYAITVMPDGRKLAIPVKTTKVKETPQIVTELMSALDVFLKGGKREDLANIFGKYLHSVFSSDKLTSDGNSFERDPNGKDRFYIDFTSKNVEGVIFGRSGGSKYFINAKTSENALEGLVKELASVIEESYININFENLKDSDFVKNHVTSNVRFYPLPNGKVTVFDNPVIGFDTSTLLNATAPAAKVTPAPTPITELQRLNNEVIRLVNIRNNDRVVRQAINDSNKGIITLEELDTVMKKWDDENGLTAAIQAYDAEKRKQAPSAPVVTPTLQVRTIENIKNEIAQFRAQEQAEYTAMSDPNDTVEKERIYDVYDKLITPLINEAEADIEARKQDTLNRISLNNEDIPQAYVKDEDTFIIGDTKDIKDLKNKIDAKYKAELNAVKQVKPTTTPTTNTQTSEKKEIKNRRNLTTVSDEAADKDNYDGYYEDSVKPSGSDEFIKTGKWIGTYINKAGEKEEVVANSEKEILDILNAKYDAELATLSEPQPTVEIPIVEPQPVQPAQPLKSAGGAKFKIRLDEDEDLSITTTEDLGIKPGVEELFDSNPELANQVYEALGFKSAIDNKFSLVKNNNLYKDNLESGINTYEIHYDNRRIGKIAVFDSGKNITIKGLNFNESERNKGLGKAFYKWLNNEANKKGGVLWGDPEQINPDAGRVWNSLDKEGLVDINKTTPRFLESQITPQQKQQAIQAYSQYLDSIFPNSKVKDIVYRRSPRKNVKSFNKREKKEGFDQPGISSITKEYLYRIENFGDNLYTILLDIKNPYNTSKDYDLLEKGEGAQEKGYDGIISNGGEINVFEPEQIHILGTKQDIEGFNQFVQSEKQIEKSVSLQNKVNTLIQEGKATKFCK